MSKDKKHANGNGNGNGAETATNGNTETAPAAAPAPDRKRLPDLFATWDKETAKVKAAEAALAAAEAARSAIVKEISAFGNGPFNFKGQQYTVRHRGPTEKRPNARELYYLASEKDQAVIDVG